jgi:hypothetical protein
VFDAAGTVIDPGAPGAARSTAHPFAPAVHPLHPTVFPARAR